MDEIDELLDRQDGVIARRQVLAAGWTQTRIARMLRRREWVPVHPGVYVSHTGPLTWQQRAWAAVLACWPAALGGWSAVRAHEGPGRRIPPDDAPIEVVVRHGRHPVRLPGVRVRRSRRFDEAAQLHASPPRQRYDDAIIDLADRARDEVRAVAVLADACGGRRTTADRLLRRATEMSRLARRDLIVAVLADVAEGTCSVLEHAYLTRVERPHGLPPGLRQVADVGADGRRVLRDVVHGGTRPRWRQVVELDGRMFHDSSTARDRDLERDLDAALGGADTVRLGYGQVVGRPCATAGKLARLFALRGWQGAPRTCPDCAAPERVGSRQAP
ncbi:type IV toxin-antitoxin system AbiEi family antitoxin domain-containing protein [Nocardioides carbamazepini]|uniref:type IV toxin-antitoxin system AbiEi family antitoxin domain-containing protein n=1 Tax=Nocardioides carbamazepini TaxID=2854259 RepID=UPI00214A2CFF|nr:type IV toxin-antitoxin system AbiEi family antitoxin domain-containing protein [Nocardioides carbamazepini]MCR1785170.1 type IV toxin-antitoxin system AbiEi family antitoxin domain-containing protein [Nocardioides carbamazepini]